MAVFHKVTIQEIIQETASAVSVVFNIPQNLTPKFIFKSGQYITLKKEIDGKEIRRAYSICSSSKSNEIKVAIKAVKNGIFSVYATSKLKKGDAIEISEPEGKFILEPAPNKNYIGFAAGSGITPVLSMIKTVLETEKSSTFTLIYANKSIKDTIFFDELNNLKNTFLENFNLHFTYTREAVTDGLRGRIDQNITNHFVKNVYKNTSFDAAFLCGPEEMIEEVSNTLKSNEISDKNIHYELFTVSVDQEKISQVSEGQTAITILLDDEETTFEMSQTDTILAASLRNDLDAPYSCQGGVCSSCLAKVTQGKAVMIKNSILTDGEVEDGFILTCQAHPTTPTITIDFDDA